jgi:hypothetical protein
MSPTHSNNFFATCTCGYTSTPLKAEGLFEPATCRECQSLVVAVRRAFRYDYEPCSNCGAALYGSDTFGTGWYVIDRPSKINCPRCKKPGMLLTSLPRTHNDDRYLFPKPGDIVHATLGRNGRITIPHIYTSSGSVWFEKTPSLPIGTIIAATVLTVSTMAVNQNELEKPQRGIKDLQLRYNCVCDFE